MRARRLRAGETGWGRIEETKPRREAGRTGRMPRSLGWGERGGALPEQQAAAGRDCA